MTGDTLFLIFGKIRKNRYLEKYRYEKEAAFSMLRLICEYIDESYSFLILYKNNYK